MSCKHEKQALFNSNQINSYDNFYLRTHNFVQNLLLRKLIQVDLIQLKTKKKKKKKTDQIVTRITCFIDQTSSGRNQTSHISNRSDKYTT